MNHQIITQFRHSTLPVPLLLPRPSPPPSRGLYPYIPIPVLQPLTSPTPSRDPRGRKRDTQQQQPSRNAHKTPPQKSRNPPTSPTARGCLLGLAGHLRSSFTNNRTVKSDKNEERGEKNNSNSNLINIYCPKRNLEMF